MDTYAKAGPESQSRLFTELDSQNKFKGGAFVGFTDNRLSAIAQRRQIDLMNAPAFPEEAGSTAPMGVPAIRGNVLQQYSDKASALRGGMCAQMAAFTNFPKAIPLGLQNDPKAFFGGGYNHYQKDVGAAADKGAAFTSIATLGGKVGDVVNGLHGWDDFVVTAKAGYTDEVGNPQDMKITFMYDQAHFSYVVKVEDSAKRGEMAGKKGGVMDELFENLTHRQKTEYTEYAGQHGGDGDRKILEATNKHIESFTKLAGEGSRFMCVRNHINNIQDNTIFYTDTDRSIKGQCYLWGIEFHHLWGIRQQEFGNKFNLTDNEVRNVILQQRFKNNNFFITAGRDYDLDNHRAAQNGDDAIGQPVAGMPNVVQ